MLLLHTTSMFTCLKLLNEESVLTLSLSFHNVKNLREICISDGLDLEIQMRNTVYALI